MDADLQNYLIAMESRIMAAIAAKLSPPIAPPIVPGNGPTLLNLSDIPHDEHGEPDYSLLADLVKTPAGEIFTFKNDFWVRGFPGAQKGTDVNLWGGARTGMAMMGGDYTGNEHLYVVRLLSPQPDRGAWTNALMTVADLGWVKWSSFVPDDAETGGQAQARWTAAGRPTVDGDGYLVVGGKFDIENGQKQTPAGGAGAFKVPGSG